MGVFAWRNLLTRPLRTILALVGLSIPILGVLGLFCLSNGLRDLVGDTLSRIEGLIILRENAPSPVFSHLPASLADDLKRLPGVRAVAPEVWGIAPPIEGRGMLANALAGRGMNSIFDQPVIAGQDITAHQNLHSAIFPRALKEKGEGRFLEPADRGQQKIVISRKIAGQHSDPDGNPKKVGDTLKIGGKPFKIIGIYETGSMILDVIVIMDIETARAILNEPKDSISCIYVEGDDPAKNEALAAAIENGPSRLRRPQHERGPGQLQLIDGPGRHIFTHDSEPGAHRRHRRDRQHHAHEHDRAVCRVRRAAHQRLVADQHPDLGDARKRVSGFAVGIGRLLAGLGGTLVLPISSSLAAFIWG